MQHSEKATGFGCFRTMRVKRSLKRYEINEMRLINEINSCRGVSDWNLENKVGSVFTVLDRYR